MSSVILPIFCLYEIPEPEMPIVSFASFLPPTLSDALGLPIDQQVQPDDILKYRPNAIIMRFIKHNLMKPPMYYE